MSDRPPRPDRAGLFFDEGPRETSSGPRHPSSPPPIEPSGADRPDLMEKVAPPAQALRNLIQSLPRRPGPMLSNVSPPTLEGIFGVAPPSFVEQPSGEGRPRPEDISASDPIPAGTDRSGTPPASIHEPETTMLRDPRGVDRRDEVITVLSTAPVAGDHPESPASHQGTFAHPPDLMAGSAADPLSSGSRIEEARLPEREPAGGSRPGVVDLSAAVGPPGAVTAAVEPPSIPGSGTFAVDRLATEPAFRGVWATTEPARVAVEVGPVGPAARRDEGFDGMPSVPAASASWGASMGEDPLSGRRGTTSAADEGVAGVDLSATNALLVQILDELRRQHQPGPFASARSVYPER